jgi:homoserine dehydrogenase
MNPVRIGMIGWGTVGTGVAKILIEDQDLIQKKLGQPVMLARIADLDLTTPRPVEVDRSILTTDAGLILNDPEISVVIELIGGLEPARTMTLQAISAGKHVVTANKALLATHGREIFAAARKNGVEVLFEASVAGCIPIIRTLKEGLAANRINYFFGILNGTANYILSSMTAEGLDFDRALAQAQEKGYAEADPTFDVEGVDTAHKLAILVALAYGSQIDLDQIFVQGINQIAAEDIQFAAEFGYVIKLLAISSLNGDRIEARVHPTMLPAGHVLSDVSGPFNAILFNGHAAGDILLYGQGAGMMPTASAVVSDVLELARAEAVGAVGRVPPLAWPDMESNRLEVKPIDDVVTRYYFRFSALDQPGVLSIISGILGTHNISLTSVLQVGREVRGSVPIVMLTHEARNADVTAALAEIDHLDVVKDKTIIFRVEDRI